MPNAPRPTAETVGPLLPKVLEFTVVLLSSAPDLSSGWIQPGCRNCDPAHPGRDAAASRPRAPAPASPRTCESGPGSPPRSGPGPSARSLRACAAVAATYPSGDRAARGSG